MLFLGKSVEVGMSKMRIFKKKMLKNVGWDTGKKRVRRLGGSAGVTLGYT